MVVGNQVDRKQQKKKQQNKRNNNACDINESVTWRTDIALMYEMNGK